MLLNSIRLSNFRNYQDSGFELSEGINIVCGENAQGKTNFLEAVSYISCVRSFRTPYKKELLRFDEKEARIEANVTSRNRSFDVDIEIFDQRAPVIRVNRIKLKRNYELAGLLKSVLFSPDDLNLVKGGAQERRRFMDTALSQLRPRYAGLLMEYNRLFDHKTRILKDSEEKPSLLDTLDDFSYRMAKIGAGIISCRAGFCASLQPEAASAGLQISGGREELQARYLTVSSVSDPGGSTEQTEKELIAHYEA
ncbi:MAG: DNA replication and repair protein RecF, partial [Bacillota bacterium]|nr:DNA replication and repair protein RecF [Bacillota bacterium]